MPEDQRGYGGTIVLLTVLVTRTRVGSYSNLTLCQCQFLSKLHQTPTGATADYGVVRNIVVTDALYLQKHLQMLGILQQLAAQRTTGPYRRSHLRDTGGVTCVC